MLRRLVLLLLAGGISLGLLVRVVADTPAAKPAVAPADNSYCYVCHANYEDEKLTKGHQVAGIGCDKCHGASIKHSGDEDGLTPPDKMFPTAEVNPFCMSCHPKADLAKGDAHKEWLAGLEPDETCSDCHNKTHRMAVRTRVWDRVTRKLVSDDGVRMMQTDSPATEAAEPDLFARKNLVAWCIVPFDAKKRGPEERAAMLERLGFAQLAYDWRAEHVPTFQAELDAIKRHNVRLTAFWFPGSLSKEALLILDLLKQNNLKTQLWVSGSGGAVKSPQEQQARVEAEANRIRPIAEAAAKIGCTVELYNHGGWGGEPENQLAVIERLKMPNVGIVYNLHHGHAHLDRFAELLKRMLPHLHALNLNGMTKDGEQKGMKILPLGQGDLDLELLKTIRASGYRGPIGILNHTGADAEARLQDNLDGLDWLTSQLSGQAPKAKPTPRSWKQP
jgi:sugar phosphate isomerase/epimerase